MINGNVVPRYGDNAVLLEFAMSVLDSYSGNLNQASKALRCSATTLARMRSGEQLGSSKIRKEWNIPIHPQRIRISADLESREQANNLHEIALENGFKSWSELCRSIAKRETVIGRIRERCGFEGGARK